MQNTLEEISPKNNEKSENENIKKLRHGPRAFERKIGYAIKKVALWRKLYHGLNLSGKNVQMSLKLAANKIHIPKKTLDDYFVQIRSFIYLILYKCFLDWGKNLGLISTIIMKKKWGF